MKQFEAILFDLDGTLLHMPQEAFIESYFRLLTERALPRMSSSTDNETYLNALDEGIQRMVFNDGSCSNSEAFFHCLAGYMQDFDKELCIRVHDDFYQHDFHLLKALSSENPLAKEAVKEAWRLSDTVILSTNPLFPRSAQEARLSWIDLKTSDFAYVTDYENSRFCKPNPLYFKELISMFHLHPENCLVVGNDLKDDIQCASSLGFPTYLVTDYMLTHGLSLFKAEKKSTFAEFLSYLKSL